MRLAALLLLLSACAAPNAAPVSPPDPAPVVRNVETLNGELGARADAYLTEAARQGFSGAVIVEAQGEVILAGGYGLADREARRPFTIDTIAQIGSITKSFTGTAIADLERQGRLDIDQPVSRYLPDAPEPGASVTLRQLLTHASGMREYCGDDFELLSRDQLLGTCMAQPLDQPLGDDGSAYSNVGFSVLAAVVEVVSGQSIEAYVEGMLRRADIDDGGYLFADDVRPRLAAGYDADVRQEPISQRIAAMHGDYWNLKGNGGMQMSARGVHRWFMHLSCREEMDEQLRQRIVRPLTEAAGDLEENAGTRVARGYGWAFRTTPNGTPFKLAHAGSDGVFFAYAYWRPYDGATFYFVSNIGEEPAREVMAELRRIVGDAQRPTDEDLAGRPDPWVCAR